ncbi:metalloregulator ArsR/SmtB family transcription factor [bacterium]|nr:metalloregulator ArsR/SmtB family transcription factor [bacterium]
MDARTQALFEARAKIIKAMAHPTRLFIVDQLSKTERCVADLTDAIGVDMSTVSKHLSVLKEAGIIEDRKQGVQVYYRLRTPCVLNFFTCVESVLRGEIQESIEPLKKS